MLDHEKGIARAPGAPSARALLVTVLGILVLGVSLGGCSEEQDLPPVLAPTDAAARNDASATSDVVTDEPTQTESGTHDRAGEADAVDTSSPPRPDASPDRADAVGADGREDADADASRDDADAMVDSGDAADDKHSDARTDAPRPTNTLAGAARASGHHMGTAVKAELLDSTSEPSYTTVLVTHFDALVSEYQMKWGTTEPMRGQFTFGPGDTIVAFAARHGMIVKGHALVWHQSLPAWVTALPTGQLGSALDAHIAAVAGHWKGQLYAWDVVNEAIAEDGSGYRDTIFFQQLGAGYIERAFRAARTADPAALLFYNDYGAEGMNAKSNRVYTMLRDLKNAGVPLDGVGLQFHVNGASPPVWADVATNLDRLIALGLVVNFSEIDIRVADVPGTAAEKLARQRTMYRDLIALCAARPKCHSASTWGFTDKYTWIDAQYGPGHVPLPFDASYAAKPAVTGIIDGWLLR